MSDNQKQWAIYPAGWVFVIFLAFALAYIITHPVPERPDVEVWLVPVEQTVIEVPGDQKVQYFTVPEIETETPTTRGQKTSSSENDVAVVSESQEGDTGTSSWTLEDHFLELLEKARVEIWKHPHPVNCEVVVFPFLNPLDWTVLAEAFWADSSGWCQVVIYLLLAELPVETQLKVMAHELGHILLKDSYPENEDDPYHSPDPGSLMYAIFDLDEEGNTLFPQSITARDRELYDGKWPLLNYKLSMPILAVD